MKALNSIAQKLIGRKYQLGGSGPDADCFSVIYEYLKMRGKQLPTEYRGITFETYPDLYRKNREKMISIMSEFFEEHLAEVPLGRRFAGDILILRLADGDDNSQLFPAIDAGNGNMIAATEKDGVRVIPLGGCEILRVFK